MNIQQAISTAMAGENLDFGDMSEVMRQIMSGEATDSQIGGFLVALAMKGESVDEVAAAALVMRELADGVKVDSDRAVDIVGTGGDGAKTFNVSTASAFVTAAAGAVVAKHGNRSVSSQSGSADVLEHLGVRLDLSAGQVAECIEQTNIGFMFAVNHHSAMRYAIGPRREMGVRTVFNVLGPLTNPAGAKNQLIGVYSSRWLMPFAQVLKQLDSRHIMVVHSADGLDEISIAAKTDCVELKNGQINSRVIDPEELGIRLAAIDDLIVDSVEQSADVIRKVLANQAGPALDMVLLNSGAAIYIAGLATSLAKGVEIARAVVESGDAERKLEALVVVSNSFDA